jgi:hypothetical protein
MQTKQSTEVPSPAPLLASGEIDTLLMMLPFYRARVRITDKGARFELVRGPRVSFDLNFDAIEQLRRAIVDPRAKPGLALPAKTDFEEANDDAQWGAARAFLAVFGVDGRHLLDATAWALDSTFKPEWPELTFSLAKFWLRPRTTRGETASAAADEWFKRAGAYEVPSEILSDVRRFYPETGG